MVTYYCFVTIFGNKLPVRYHFVTISVNITIFGLECLMTSRLQPFGNHYFRNLELHTNFQLDWINFTFLLTSPSIPSPHPTGKFGLGRSSSLTSACVHVVYVCLFSCCLRVLVFMYTLRGNIN